MPAGTEYLFRHALARDAAYELHLPAERARLHVMAADAIIRATEAERLDAASAAVASHIALARVHADSVDLRQREREFTFRAAMYASARHNMADMLQLWRRTAEICTGFDFANALRNLGAIHEIAGRVAEASQAYERSLSAFREQGHRLGVATVLCQQGVMHVNAQNYKEAARCYDESASVFGANTQFAEFRQLLSNRAALLGEIGKLPEARRVQRRALALQVRAGDVRSQGVSLNNLAYFAHESGEVTRARKLYRRAIEKYREAGERISIAIALGNYGNLCAQTGHGRLAWRLLEESRDLHVANGNLRGLSLCLSDMAVALLAIGDSAKAATAARSALEAANECHNDLARSAALIPLGLAMGPAGEAALLQAAGLAKSVGHARAQSTAALALAEHLLEHGRAQQAHEQFKHARAFARKAGNVRNAALASCGLALCLRELGQPRKARKHWKCGRLALIRILDRRALARFRARLRHSAGTAPSS